MEIIEKLIAANRKYIEKGGDLRRKTAKNGQHPYAIVICCSDSRVIPEKIFGADIGELFVIRVAGNVLDNHQLGSIEYAVSHLHCPLVIMLGHTGCGAVSAALSGHSEGFISSITDEIAAAVGGERDPDKACRLNVIRGVDLIKREFSAYPEFAKVDVCGAVYDIESGAVEWLGQ